MENLPIFDFRKKGDVQVVMVNLFIFFKSPTKYGRANGKDISIIISLYSLTILTVNLTLHTILHVCRKWGPTIKIPKGSGKILLSIYYRIS